MQGERKINKNDSFNKVKFFEPKYSPQASRTKISECSKKMIFPFGFCGVEMGSIKMEALSCFRERKLYRERVNDGCTFAGKETGDIVRGN